uniref:Coiled-coil domain-containing protein 130 n=1 Tax=Romanomermis culicivorax TaxID=13658 RepID=A0A915HY51_ROMCU
MGERKGQNKYYPPDYDPKKGGLNKWQGTHALRERARKLHMGILIIRFEMPFNVWCDGCGNHVGMGVRYNAEKKKVGMYYTTPLYEFKMKCHLCTNHFIIRTDPKNFDYELVDGLRRQEKRWDMASNEQIASTEKEKRQKLATDAMYKLEHGEIDAAKSKLLEPELNRLQSFQHRLKDDFSRNQELRRIFRTTKKQVAEQSKKDNLLLAKSSLVIKLVPENEEDVKLASLISKYKTVQGSDEKAKTVIEKLDNESIFDHQPCSSKSLTLRKTPSTSITDCVLRGSLKRPIDNRRLIETSVRKGFLREKMAKSQECDAKTNDLLAGSITLNNKKIINNTKSNQAGGRTFDEEKNDNDCKTEASKLNSNLSGLGLIGQFYDSSSSDEISND